VASETFVTALLIITGIVAAGILISAVYPVVWNMAGTFSSSAQQSDVRMRTDIKITSTWAVAYPPDVTPCSPSPPSYFCPNVKIWLKNVGTTSIGQSEIEKSDILTGNSGNFIKVNLQSGKFNLLPNSQFSQPDSLALANTWSYSCDDINHNNQWDSGETLEIDALTPISSSSNVYFQITLPSGVWRSTEFSTS
jgi:flagellar protein FlaG